jgi:hypothetical protein
VSASASVSPRRVERKIACSQCGTKQLTYLDSLPPGLCDTCMHHKVHAGDYCPSCALCVVWKWRARFQAVGILVFQLFIPPDNSLAIFFPVGSIGSTNYEKTLYHPSSSSQPNETSRDGPYHDASESFPIGIGRQAARGALTPPPIVPPTVRVYRGRMDSFIGDGPGSGNWHRMAPEDMVYAHTGYDVDTHEPSVGGYVIRRQTASYDLMFGSSVQTYGPRWSNIWRNRWTQDVTSLSKSMRQNVLRRPHFSKSFARFEVSLDRIESLKDELSAVLSNAERYQRRERGPTVPEQANPPRLVDSGATSSSTDPC